MRSGCWTRARAVVAVAAVAVGAVALGPCRPLFGVGSPFLFFSSPRYAQLSETGAVEFELRSLIGRLDAETLRLRVDGELVEPEGLAGGDGRITGAIPDPGAGAHRLSAKVEGGLPSVLSFFLPRLEASTRVELVSLERPGTCELLNQADCVLPYPSSRYLAPADTATGVTIDFPADALPAISLQGNLAAIFGDDGRVPLDPEPYNRLDGFSPTVQVHMHFPQGVDLEASDAPRLREETRTFGGRSLEPDSPTVLIDAETGERVAHFIENDSRAEDPARRVTFLRPGKSLLPGHRYLVAVRDLEAPDGEPVEAEPVFAALRDRRPTDIPAVKERRPEAEKLFRELRHHGIRRHDLVLAFDFVVQSDESLASQMLAMRDEAFAWLAEQRYEDVITVEEDALVTPAEECPANPDAIWRVVRGTFTAPLYLTSDPGASPPPPADPIAEPDTLGVLATDAEGRPVRTGHTEAPFGLALPCSVVLEGPAPPLVFGHGLFGNGPDTVAGIGEALGETVGELKDEGILPSSVRFDYVAGGTNWSGLSSLEVPPLPDELPTDVGGVGDIPPEQLEQLLDLVTSFIGGIFLDFDRFEALPDRLRQGQLQTLVFARLMSEGAFDEVAGIAGPEGGPVLDASEPTQYFGASLGGIMGLMFAALTPDVERLNVDVPAINFSLLLQRAKPFKPLQQFLNVVDSDPLTQTLGLQLLHELWVRGESAGYAHHITGNTLAPLEGPRLGTNEKRILMTVARFDQQVSPLAAQIAAATLEIPNLVPGSVREELPLVPDAGGPLASAHVLYDTGSYVPGEDDAFIPPLANRPAPEDDNECDPHGLRGFIPASIQQLTSFLRPGGVVENFCDGACDASRPLEIPGGMATPCDPDD